MSRLTIHLVRGLPGSGKTTFALRLAEEKDRGDAFEIFVEAYLATQAITQRVKHWVVGSIPLPLRER